MSIPDSRECASDLSSKFQIKPSASVSAPTEGNGSKPESLDPRRALDADAVRSSRKSRPLSVSEAIEEFRQWAITRGCRGDVGIIPDGEIHRCHTGEHRKKKNGAYYFHSDGVINGGHQDWGNGETEFVSWFPESAPPLTDSERDLLNEQKRKRDKMERVKRTDAAKLAELIISNSSAASADHPYLKRKNVGSHGVRATSQGLIDVLRVSGIAGAESYAKHLHGEELLIPYCDIYGRAHSLQTLYASGDRYNLSGGATSGYFCTLCDLRGASTILIAEGYATAATVYEATGLPTVASMFAGNLEPVARVIRKEYPGARIIVVADDDWRTEGNPGATHAQKAAGAVDGIVWVPDFSGVADRGPKDTDANDLMRLAGLGEVKRQILTTSEQSAGDDKPDEIFCAARDKAEELRYKDYPTRFLPEPLRELVVEASASIGCDHSFVALPLLVVAASAIGATRKARIKRGWEEPAVLWEAIVGDSGSQKTPALDAATDAIENLQRTEYREWRVAVEKWEEEIAARPKSDKTRPPSKPILVDRYLSDITTEAIVARLVVQDPPRGVPVIRDEISGWIQSFNQYKGGHGGDAATWLSMYGAKAVRVDRKTNNETSYVPYAAVSIVGGVQPQILAECFSGQNVDNGLLARFLFAYPPKRLRVMNDRIISEDTKAKVRDLYIRLCGLQFGVDQSDTPVPIIIPLDGEARSEFDAWFREMAVRQVRSSGANTAALSKIEGVAARLALVYQLVTDPKSTKVGVRAIKAGIALARWHADEAERIYAILDLGADPKESSDRAALIDVVRKHGPISPRDVERHCRKWRGRGNEMAVELCRLRDSGTVIETGDRDPRNNRVTYRYALAGDVTPQKDDDFGDGASEFCEKTEAPTPSPRGDAGKHDGDKPFDCSSPRNEEEVII